MACFSGARQIKTSGEYTGQVNQSISTASRYLPVATRIFNLLAEFPRSRGEGGHTQRNRWLRWQYLDDIVLHISSSLGVYAPSSPFVERK